MSRIGKTPVKIPEKVKINVSGGKVTVEGPKGSLEYEYPSEITLKVEDDQVVFERPSDIKRYRALHGLTRALLANMVEGVTRGFTKSLEIHGVGYRAEMKGKNLQLMLGFSHPIYVVPPPGISIEVEGNNKVKVNGIDKQLVGQIAASIRSFRPPEPYKGKGVRYEGEIIRRKAGKTAA